MIKTLDERKKDLLNVLKEEYSEKPRRWWQGKQPEYITTWEYSERSDHFRPVSEETIIRYNLKGALRGSASFFIIYSLMYFFQIGELDDGNFLFSTVVFSFFYATSDFERKKKKAKNNFE